MKKLLPLAVLAISVAMPALANDGHKGKYDGRAKTDYYFNQIDTNKNGRISRSEHQAFGSQMFEEADRDNSGSLDRREMVAQRDRQKDEYQAYNNANPDRYAYNDRYAPAAGNETTAVRAQTETPMDPEMSRAYRNTPRETEMMPVDRSY